MSFKQYLQKMVAVKGSDLFLNSGAPVSVKAFGKIAPLHEEVLDDAALKKMIYEEILENNAEKISTFERQLEMNLAISDPQIGRFRINIYQQSNSLAVVVRSITTEIPSIEELGLPQILKEIIMIKRGLVIVVGATSSGKSTTLASMIDYRNERNADHIITIEDPIEFVHHHKKSIISQREVGVDTLNFGAALKNTLRQAPDVILIGEIRDQDTMQYAINFAETGHLCLSTLHANNANQALERIINFFPHGTRTHILQDLALNLAATISMRLIPTIEGGNRAPAVEVMLASSLIKEFIMKGDIIAIKEQMEKNEGQGMQTFDMALFKLYEEGRISLDEALKNADSANNLRLRIQLSKGANPGDSGLSLKE